MDKINFKQIFSNIPENIISELEKRYTELFTNYYHKRFEPSELNGAKFCECIVRTLQFITTGSYTPFGQNLGKDFSQIIRGFENNTNFSDSIRLHIPRLVNSIYTIRNHRGVGHIGNNIDPNEMDANIIISSVRWILAELVRETQAISVDEAIKTVKILTNIDYPIVWEVNNKKRILNIKLTYKEKILVLLYSNFPDQMNYSTLFSNIEHSNTSNFKKLLKKMHKEKFIEFDEKQDIISISPKGSEFVYKNIDLTKI